MIKRVLTMTAAVAAASASAAPPSQEEMWEIIQQQQKEIQQLKGQLQETDSKVEATADAVETVASGQSGTASWASKTSIGGYGEHHFNHFEEKDDMVDAHRFVVFIGHQFSDTVRFFSEVELEHGLTEDTDDGSGPGEVELEQAYIEWDFAKNHSVQFGQFLLPVGIINETHEPDTFYGVERNKVEADIIPATWWETGVKVGGEIAPGLRYDVAVHSGLDTGTGQSIRSGRQKSAKANAEDLAMTTRIKYTGVAGLELAATYQLQQDISQGNSGDGDNEAELVTAHAMYQVGALKLTALWASWDVDGQSFETVGADDQTGWYTEASYKLTSNLGVFVRQSEWNTTAGDSSVADNEQVDFGLNYWLHPQVVLKADYTDDRNNEDGSDNDAFNLGVGWSF